MNPTLILFMLLALTGCSGVRESVTQGVGSLYEGVGSLYDSARSAFSRSPSPSPTAPAPAPSSASTPTAAPAPATAPASTPSAQSYFSTRVCGVQIDGRTKEARLRIEVVPTSRLPANALIEVQFENPAEGGAPLVVTTVHKGGGRALGILSPPVEGVRPRSYEVIVRVYDSAARKAMLAAMTHPCPSLVDDREL